MERGQYQGPDENGHRTENLCERALRSDSGQSRPKSDVRLTSALLLITTEQRTSHEVGSGPIGDIGALGAAWTQPRSSLRRYRRRSDQFRTINLSREGAAPAMQI